MISKSPTLGTDDDWYTPKWFVDKFGKFDYDPATTPERAKILDIPHYDTIETDGLKSDWTPYKRIWINPPFTRKPDFLRKAVETYNQTKADIYFLCPIMFLTAKVFHSITVGGAFICQTVG